MEAGSTAFSFGSSASLATRNVYVGSFTSELKQHAQINQPTKQPSTEILEIARRLPSANYFMGQSFSVSVWIKVQVTSRHLSILPLWTKHFELGKETLLYKSPSVACEFIQRFKWPRNIRVSQSHENATDGRAFCLVWGGLFWGGLGFF